MQVGDFFPGLGHRPSDGPKHGHLSPEVVARSDTPIAFLRVLLLESGELFGEVCVTAVAAAVSSSRVAMCSERYTEHMWLAPVTYDGGKFVGTVNNDPEKVKSVKMGQRVTVAPDKISDWMYIDNHRLVGGETLRVLRAAMPPAERAGFDRSMPFTID